MKRKLILASGSPRRRELMEQMGLVFEVDKLTSFKEIVPEGMLPGDVPAYFAEGKAAGFHRPLADNEVLVSADTIVVCEGRIMGKPKDAEDAARMLRELSGRPHQVISAVCVMSNQKKVTMTDVADVVFEPLSDEQISYYVDNFNPVDKAGAYGIQEWIGLTSISSIKGSFYTIMGLPTHLLYKILRDFS